MPWKCPSCGGINGDPVTKCSCGNSWKCPSCGNTITGPITECGCGYRVNAGNDNHTMKAERIILTTAPNIEGYRIIETVEIITSECVFGMNIFRDIFAAWRDVFGGRSEASQNVLRDARKTCLNELKREAARINADAVIAVDLDYSEFSGGGKSMLFLVASGTAVRIEKLVEERAT